MCSFSSTTFLIRNEFESRCPFEIKDCGYCYGYMLPYSEELSEAAQGPNSGPSPLSSADLETLLDYLYLRIDADRTIQ